MTTVISYTELGLNAELEPGFEIRKNSKGSFGPLTLKLWGSTLIFKGPRTTTLPVHVYNYLHQVKLKQGVTEFLSSEIVMFLWPN